MAASRTTPSRNEFLTQQCYGVPDGSVPSDCGGDSSLLYLFPQAYQYLLGKVENPNNTREKYVLHHRRILIALIICWVFPAFNNNGAMRDWLMEYSENLGLVFQHISFGFLMLTGTFVNLARLSEPHVYANVRVE